MTFKVNLPPEYQSTFLTNTRPDSSIGSQLKMYFELVEVKKDLAFFIISMILYCLTKS